MASPSEAPQEDVVPAPDPVEADLETLGTSTIEEHPIPWRLLFPLPLPPHQTQSFNTWPATWPPVVRKNNE